jgi:hypothetical protein
MGSKGFQEFQGLGSRFQGSQLRREPENQTLGTFGTFGTLGTFGCSVSIEGYGRGEKRVCSLSSWLLKFIHLTSSSVARGRIT